MKTDRYTKIVLTVIAMALVVLTCQNFFEIKSATAITQPEKIMKVALCDTSGKFCADTWTRNAGNGTGIGIGVYNLR
jgi:hypothetical protein